eukprot:Rmarinus@m.26395
MGKSQAIKLQAQAEHTKNLALELSNKEGLSSKQIIALRRLAYKDFENTGEVDSDSECDEQETYTGERAPQRARVELTIECDNLPKNLSQETDAVVVCYMKDNGKWVEKGRTEIIFSNPNPRFATPFMFTYVESMKQQLVFKVFAGERNDRSENLIGEASTTLTSIMRVPLRRRSLKLKLCTRVPITDAGLASGTVTQRLGQLGAEESSMLMEGRPRQQLKRSQVGGTCRDLSSCVVGPAKGIVGGSLNPVDCGLGKAVASTAPNPSEAALTQTKQKLPYDGTAVITVRANILQKDPRYVKMEIRGERLYQTVGQYPNIYFTIARWVLGYYEIIYRSEIIYHNWQPQWDEFVISLNRLCCCNMETHLRFDVMDAQLKASQGLIGRVETTLGKLLEHFTQDRGLQVRCLDNHNGVLLLKQCELMDPRENRKPHKSEHQHNFDDLTFLQKYKQDEQVYSSAVLSSIVFEGMRYLRERDRFWAAREDNEKRSDDVAATIEAALFAEEKRIEAIQKTRPAEDALLPIDLDTCSQVVFEPTTPRNLHGLAGMVNSDQILESPRSLRVRLGMDPFSRELPSHSSVLSTMEAGLLFLPRNSFVMERYMEIAEERRKKKLVQDMSNFTPRDFGDANPPLLELPPSGRMRRQTMLTLSQGRSRSPSFRSSPSGPVPFSNFGASSSARNRSRTNSGLGLGASARSLLLAEVDSGSERSSGSSRPGSPVVRRSNMEQTGETSPASPTSGSVAGGQEGSQSPRPPLLRSRSIRARSRSSLLFPRSSSPNLRGLAKQNSVEFELDPNREICDLAKSAQNDSGHRTLLVGLDDVEDDFSEAGPAPLRRTTSKTASATSSPILPSRTMSHTVLSRSDMISSPLLGTQSLTSQSPIRPNRTSSGHIPEAIGIETRLKRSESTASTARPNGDPHSSFHTRPQSPKDSATRTQHAATASGGPETTPLLTTVARHVPHGALRPEGKRAQGVVREPNCESTPLAPSSVGSQTQSTVKMSPSRNIARFTGMLAGVSTVYSHRQRSMESVATTAQKSSESVVEQTPSEFPVHWRELELLKFLRHEHQILLSLKERRAITESTKRNGEVLDKARHERYRKERVEARQQKKLREAAAAATTATAAEINSARKLGSKTRSCAMSGNKRDSGVASSSKGDAHTRDTSPSAKDDSERPPAESTILGLLGTGVSGEATNMGANPNRPGLGRDSAGVLGGLVVTVDSASPRTNKLPVDNSNHGDMNLLAAPSPARSARLRQSSATEAEGSHAPHMSPFLSPRASDSSPSKSRSLSHIQNEPITAQQPRHTTAQGRADDSFSPRTTSHFLAPAPPPQHETSQKVSECLSPAALPPSGPPPVPPVSISRTSRLSRLSTPRHVTPKFVYPPHGPQAFSKATPRRFGSRLSSVWGSERPSSVGAWRGSIDSRHSVLSTP